MDIDWTLGSGTITAMTHRTLGDAVQALRQKIAGNNTLERAAQKRLEAEAALKEAEQIEHAIRLAAKGYTHDQLSTVVPPDTLTVTPGKWQDSSPFYP